MRPGEHRHDAAAPTRSPRRPPPRRDTVDIPHARGRSTFSRTDTTMNSTRAALMEHWDASERGDTEAEHAIYAPDAILDYPQSGERFRGRTTIAGQRGGHPA